MPMLDNVNVDDACSQSLLIFDGFDGCTHSHMGTGTTSKQMEWVWWNAMSLMKNDAKDEKAYI